MRAALILVATLYAPTHAFSVSWVRSGPGMRMRAARMVSDETVASIFAEFDADNSGFIDVGELQAALASAGQSVSTEECKVVFQGINKNRDGKVSLEEFAEALAAASVPKSEPPSMLARRCFQEFDADNSGFIDLEEVCRAPPLRLPTIIFTLSMHSPCCAHSTCCGRGRVRKSMHEVTPDACNCISSGS